MKNKICLMILLLILVFLGFLISPQNSEYEYLRLHIRANSNLVVDQNVKYKVKESVVEFLTPIFNEVKSKTEAIEMVGYYISDIENVCNKVLKDNNLNYVAKVKVNNEYFPTRSYQNTTLESGFYDAVIIELGEAKGDNWWCVMYPPLCFVNNFENNMQIKYKSKILEWISSIFN